MARKLTQREMRTVMVGAVAVVAILAFAFGGKGFDHWQKVRTSLESARAKLASVTTDQTKQAGLLSIVPAAELPQLEEEQKVLFRDKLYEQLKKAGIKVEPLTIQAARRKANLPYRVLMIKCKGKCKFDQLLNFLATLNENPYLVAVEELSFKCDMKQPPEKRKDIEIELTVSTYVKPPQIPQQTNKS